MSTETPDPALLRAELYDSLDRGADSEAQSRLLNELRERWEIPPAEMVAKLPKGKKDSGDYKGCKICGGYHPENWIHLDYVGHADVTRILIIEDPLWSWEPMAFDGGLPVMTRDQRGNPIGLWIRLTIFGVTRIGYGSCDSTKTDPEKELIGDALRNAAMRFGIATKLWSKAEWDGAPEGRSSGVDHHAPGTSFDEALTPEQISWRAKGWPASTHTEAVSHAVQTSELKARILAMPEETQARIKEFRQKLNNSVWPPVPGHFDEIVAFLDSIDAESPSEPLEAPSGTSAHSEPEKPTTGDTGAEKPLTMGDLAKHTTDEVAERAQRVNKYCSTQPIEIVEALGESHGARFLESEGEKARRKMIAAALVSKGWDPDVADAGWDDQAETK